MMFKPLLYLCVFALLCASTTHAQNWQVELTSGRTYRNVGLDRLQGDQLYLFHYPLKTRYDRSRPLPVGKIVRIAPYHHQPNRLRLNVINGALLGLALGTGFAVQFTWLGLDETLNNPDHLPYILGAIVLGSGAVGALSGLSSNRIPVIQRKTATNKEAYHPYDFSGLSADDKMTALREIMQAFNRPWRR